MNEFQTERYNLIGATVIFGGRSSWNRAKKMCEEDMYKNMNRMAKNNAAYKKADKYAWSGPIYYYNRSGYTNENLSIDIHTAYASYLAQNKLPGLFRSRHEGYILPFNEDMRAYYIVEFAYADLKLEFEAIFLNAMMKDKGKILKFELGNIGRMKIWDFLIPTLKKYMPSAKIIETVLCSDFPLVNVNSYLVKELIAARRGIIEHNFFTAEECKIVLASSTGWLNRLDEAAYYQMVQATKFKLYDEVLKHIEWDDIIGINTDGVVVKNPSKYKALAESLDEQYYKVEYNIILKQQGRMAKENGKEKNTKEG